MKQGHTMLLWLFLIYFVAQVGHKLVLLLPLLLSNPAIRWCQHTCLFSYITLTFILIIFTTIIVYKQHGLTVCLSHVIAVSIFITPFQVIFPKFTLIPNFTAFNISLCLFKWELNYSTKKYRGHISHISIFSLSMSPFSSPFSLCICLFPLVSITMTSLRCQSLVILGISSWCLLD